MKKLTLTIALIIGITTCTFAQEYSGDRGMFGRGNDQGASWGRNLEDWMDGLFQNMDYEEYRGETDEIILPGEHGLDEDTEGSPLGTGIAVLTALGAAYLVGKKRKEE